MVKNRKFKRLVKRTSLLIGTGAALCGATVIPVVAPVTNVYAAVDSYDAEQSEFESKLTEAKKTTGLTVKENVETIDVTASQAEAKKKEIAEKIDAETSKLQNAIDKQNKDTADTKAKNKNPDLILKEYNEYYDKKDIIDLLTNNGEFDVSNLNEFDFRNITGFSTNARRVDATLVNNILSGCSKFDYQYSIIDVLKDYNEYSKNFSENGGEEHSSYLIPKVGDVITFYNVNTDTKTGKKLDTRWTVTNIETVDITDNFCDYWQLNAAEREALRTPIFTLHRLGTNEAAIANRGNLKSISFKIELLEHGTDNVVNSDVGFSGGDIDSSQYFIFSPSDKKILTRNTTLTISGDKISGEAKMYEDDSITSASVIKRNTSSINFTWGTNDGRNPDMSYPCYEEWLYVNGLDLGFQTIKTPTSAVEVTKYALNVTPDPQPDPVPDPEPVIQKGSVAYVDKTTGKTLETKAFKGESNTSFNYNTTDTIKKYTDMGYKLVSSDYPSNPNNQMFDNDPDTDQDFTVILEQQIVNIPPDNPGYDITTDQLNKTIKRTIFYKYENKDGKDVYEPITQTVKLTRSATKNLVTGEVKFTPWTEGKMDSVVSQPKTNYTFDREIVNGVDPVTSESNVKDEYVIYNMVPQKGSVDFTDKTSSEQIAPTKKLNGNSGTPFNYTPDSTITELKNVGYDLVSNDYPTSPGEQVFDNDPNTDQDFHVVMTPHIETVPPDQPKTPGDTPRPGVEYPPGLEAKDLNKTVTRKIYYKYNSVDGEDVFEPVTQTVKLTRTAKFNYVTGKITYGNWTVGSIDDVKSPVKENYSRDRAVVAGVPEVTVDTKLEDQYVIYKKISQKGSVDFTDRKTGNPIADTKNLNGYQGEPFNYTPNATIKTLENKGWDLVSNDFPKDPAEQVYDTDSTVNQDYHVVMTPHIETVPPDQPKKPGDTPRPDVEYPQGLQDKDLNKTLTRTIYYKYNDRNGDDVFEPVTQTVKLSREAKFNYVTGEIVYGDWSVASIKEVKSPDKENYSYDRSVVAGVPEVTVDTTLEDEYVIYRKIPQKGTVDFTDRDTTDQIAPTKKLDGYQTEPFNYTPDTTIKTLENKGWDLVSNDFPTDEGDQVYDKDPDKDQNYHVVFTPHIEDITHDDPKNPGDKPRPDVEYPKGLQEQDLNKTLTRTIFYKYDSKTGEDAFEPVVQTVTLTRNARFNYVTGEIVYGDWTVAKIKDADSPVLENYSVDRAVVEGVPEVTVDTELEDQYVIYKKIPQKGSVDFKDRDTQEDIVPVKELNGFQAEPFDYTPDDTIADLENKGWDLVDNDFPTDPKDQVYDKDTETDQDYHVVLTPHIETITPDDPKTPGTPTDRDEVNYPEGVDADDLNMTFKRTIFYKYESPEGEDVFEPIVQMVTLTRTATFNYVTGEVEYSDWTTAIIEDVESQTKEHWQFDRAVVEGVELTNESEPLEDENVIYTRIPEKGKVEFLDEEGNPIADTHKLDGFDEDPFDYDPTPTMDDLHNKGWDLVTNDYPANPEDQVFDSDPEVDQDFKIVHTPHIETITADNPKKPDSDTDRKDVKYPEGVDEADLNKTFTRTIYFKYNDRNGNDVFEPVKQEVHLTREAKFNYVTGEVEYGEWTTGVFESVDAIKKDGYEFDRYKVDGLDMTIDSKDPEDEFIIYTPVKKDETKPVTNIYNNGSPTSDTSTVRTSGTNTGDANKTGLFSAIGIGAAAVIGGVAAFMKKRKKTEDEDNA